MSGTYSTLPLASHFTPIFHSSIRLELTYSKRPHRKATTLGAFPAVQLLTERHAVILMWQQWLNNQWQNLNNNIGHPCPRSTAQHHWFGTTQQDWLSLPDIVHKRNILYTATSKSLYAHIWSFHTTRTTSPHSTSPPARRIDQLKLSRDWFSVIVPLQLMSCQQTTLLTPSGSITVTWSIIPTFERNFAPARFHQDHWLCWGSQRQQCWHWDTTPLGT